MARKNKVKKYIGAAILGSGLLLFMGGLYLLPIGTDAWLYFFVDVVAGGNWFWGDVYANIAALGLVVVG